MSTQTDLKRDNPFPGMNLYLEQHWRDVHTSLMIYLRDQLQAGLPEGLWASVEEEVLIDEAESGPVGRVHPDVQVSESWGESRGLATAVGGLAVAEPVVLLDPEPATERCVQIFAAGGRLITAVEVLSPTNKRRYERRSAYRRKRRTYQEGGVHVVEIDLIRDGDYLVLAPEELIPASQRAPYIVSVWRATEPGVKFAYPCPLAKPLPRIAVPLRPRDTDAVLDLQELIDLCYVRGRYHARLDYHAEPEPPLEPADAQWADQLLRTAGLRS
jgi:hypothetical protein